MNPDPTPAPTSQGQSLDAASNDADANAGPGDVGQPVSSCDAGELPPGGLPPPTPVPTPSPTPVPTPTPPPCPPMEIQINNTPAANDDLVILNMPCFAAPPTVQCQIRTTGGPDSTVVLTNPDGRLRFPGPGDQTLQLAIPGSGAWVAFQISGQSASAAIGDAVIEVHCSTATGPTLVTKPVTVFSFDTASITLTPGSSYSIVGRSYTAGGHAADFSAVASIKPAGVDCGAPQVQNLRIGIMQESSNFAAITTWSAPTVSWLPGVASGTSITVATTMRQTDGYAANVAMPVADTDANCTPLYDQPGKPTTLDQHSTMPPNGCAGGGPATSFDTPSQGVAPRLVQTVSSGGQPAARVTWTNPVAARTEHFRTYCVLFDTSNNQFCALRQATWDLDLDSSRGTPQKATATADGPATATPATGVAANDAPTSSNTAGVGAATTTFVKP